MPWMRSGTAGTDAPDLRIIFRHSSHFDKPGRSLYANLPTGAEGPMMRKVFHPWFPTMAYLLWMAQKRSAIRLL